MSPGELLTRWTVRVALAFYVLALTLRLGTSRRDLARLCWSAGCLTFLLHMACAFHFFHHWSHREAFEATSRQTESVVGLDWGGGIYANYVFAAVWILDACWWWMRPEGYLNRSRAIEWVVQGFMAFIAFNATVVFGTGAVRWWGAAGSVLLLTLAVVAHRRDRRRSPTSEVPSSPS